MRILVTGFERFGPNDLNPTALLMDRLAGRDGVIAAVLPVEYHTSVKRFEALLDEHRPDAAVAFGLARSYDQIRVERVALNLDEAAVPDNAGVLRCGLRIVEDGPVGYWSTLPVDRLIDALDRSGLAGCRQRPCRRLCLQPPVLRRPPRSGAAWLAAAHGLRPCAASAGADRRGAGADRPSP